MEPPPSLSYQSKEEIIIMLRLSNLYSKALLDAIREHCDNEQFMKIIHYQTDLYVAAVKAM
jgi:hypothetical protein